MPVALPVYAAMTASLSDPLGSSPLVAAVQWLQGTVLGTIAVTVAVVAVAFVGVMMLLGRVDLRHGATVIGGCFVLFGASSIVAGIQSTVAGAGGAHLPPPPSAAPPEPPPALIVGPAHAARDPYAGAAVPPR